MNNKFLYISYLRVFAMLMIIAAHTICTPVIYHSVQYSSFGLYSSVILTNIFRTGVLVFVMISGALFLRPEKELPIKKLLSRNVMRVFFVLLFFGFLFALMEILFTEKSFSFSIIFVALLRVLENHSWGHLWYLYMLIGLYLITPLLKKYIDNSSDKELYYLLSIIFVCNLFFPLINEWCHIKIAFVIPISGRYIFYYLLGYFLHTRKIDIKTPIAFVFILLGVMYLVLMAVFGAEVDVPKVVFVDTFNLGFLVDLFPIGLFCIFNNIQNYKKIFL
ncbi:MAG: acyltransferase family protein [Treponema sp.]|nr:acyltransferase family protein [Treponema sp.]